jgi:hypothetical protein
VSYLDHLSWIIVFAGIFGVPQEWTGEANHTNPGRVPPWEYRVILTGPRDVLSVAEGFALTFAG